MFLINFFCIVSATKIFYFPASKCKPVLYSYCLHNSLLISIWNSLVMLLQHSIASILLLHAILYPSVNLFQTLHWRRTHYFSWLQTDRQTDRHSVLTVRSHICQGHERQPQQKIASQQVHFCRRQMPRASAHETFVSLCIKRWSGGSQIHPMAWLLAGVSYSHSFAYQTEGRWWPPPRPLI